MEASNPTGIKREFLIVAFCLTSVLLILLWPSLQPNNVVFANDGPLGAINSAATQLPAEFKGLWWDTTWIGRSLPSAPNLSTGTRMILGPLGYAKFYPFVCLFVLGLSAWFFCKHAGFHPAVRLLVALAAALNSNVLSNMAWGQGSRPLALAAAFLALAAIYSSRRGHSWIKIILAGLAVGWGVSEGFDVGALFSIVVALFVVFFSFITAEPWMKKLGLAVVRTLVIAAFAGLLAAQTIIGLLETQLKKSPTTEAAEMTEEQRWQFITDLSTPKLETLGVIIPGLFGYATTTPGEKQYWGNQSSFNGSGEYAGILVVIIAFAAIAFSFARKDKLTKTNRYLIWFWAAMALISLLFAFGKHAPFYHLIYPLPFFSTMRNPMKFMHVFHFCLLILFGFGLQTIYELYLKNGISRAGTWKQHLLKWWAGASSFDRKFVIILLLALGAGLLGWLVYSSAEKDLINAMQKGGIDAARATATAGFSISTVGWFVLFLALSVCLLTLILSGWFSGKKVKTAFILLGLLLVTDLVRANMPWFIFWDYTRKYATNPIIEILRDKPYEKRVDLVPFRHPEMSWLSMLFGAEWTQHHFPYYNIHTVHVVQDPRPQPDDAAFRQAFGEAQDPLRQFELLARKWELTSTRFVFWLNGPFIDAINQQFPAAKGRFKMHTGFDIVPKQDMKPGEPIGLPDLTAVTNPNGKFALVEFTGALPKAKLYSNWEVIPDSNEVLKKITSSDFDPHASVVIQEDIGAPASPNEPAGTAEFVSYAPKHIVLAAEAKTPALLLLNDKYHPDWKVWVDGKPAKLLRANYLMRGVQIPEGKHQVVFKFEPPLTMLYVTLSAIGLGIVLCGFLFVAGRKNRAAETVPVKAAK